MKQKILISLTLLFLSFQYGYSENPFKTIDISKVNENTIIKDAHGKIKAISMSELRKLMSTGKWVLKPENDSITGKLKSVYLTDKGDFERFKAGYDEARKKFIAFVNTKAPVFEAKDINGNIISSKKAKGKVMVLYFWFVDCWACAPELPEVNAAYEKYKDNKDIIFAAITFDKLDKVKIFLKESKSYIKYPIVTDGDDIVDLFGIDGFPTNIIIDKKGYYYYKSSGYDTSGRPSGIAKKIEAALQGKKAYEVE